MGYVVAFDIDGTLTDDIQIMKESVRAWNFHVGEDPCRIVKLDMTSPKLVKFSSFCSPEEFWLYTESIQRFPEITGYARDLIRALRVLGCTIVLISKRAISSCHAGENTQSDTAIWLHRNGVDYDQLICTNEETKVPYLMKYSCDYIVENDPSILKDLQEHHCSTIPVLIRKPYNHSIEAYQKDACIWINSVYDLYSIIVKRIREDSGTDYEKFEQEHADEYESVTTD